ncbi:FAD-dependent oxidoreductase [Mesorhizobium sp. ES1-3]|uniref:FAD-dependent oxidoreductase n=1 Tax=Mesorhizobium sp. ES1-3 TaxID=2876628 RepID=UPI001CD00A6D|nr:FAD-dependent oxidoreductase [Mesorhizobium sp. ES1-3]MBZ9670912.1 FAD-dependent oxidoreductase [Mesorhizobium sp. ES1-3]
MKLTRGRVAILGAGIMGASLAIMMARLGCAVTLFDKEDEPLSCASRWNEGKIHLGYLYGADPSMRTARHVIPGGLRFGKLISQLLDEDLRPHTTPADDVYLVHRRSVVDAQTLSGTFRKVDALLREHPDASQYLVDVSKAGSVRLSRAELAAMTDSDDIVAGFRVPERSVDTQWIADRMVEVVRSEPNISLRMRSKILSATPTDGIEGQWRVAAETGRETFDVVVNCLWEGRLAIDRLAGIEPSPGWSHRYRLSLFGCTGQPVDVVSSVIALGPFGDIKNYDGRRFYISWYPTGLVAQSGALTLAQPDEIAMNRRQFFVDEVRTEITRLIPDASRLFEAAQTIDIRGGFVFAQGQGSLSDLGATIHRRDLFGTARRGNYLSVDTGKYSTAPWLADMLAKQLYGVG